MSLDHVTSYPKKLISPKGDTKHNQYTIYTSTKYYKRRCFVWTGVEHGMSLAAVAASRTA